MQLDSASRVVAIPDQVSCDIAGDVAILSLRNGVYYGLNPVGARIWGLLQQPVTLQTILDTILAEYEVSPAICESDIRKVLSDLAANGLVEPA